MFTLSVVVHCLNICGTHFTPLEADAPPIIDTDAVLTLSVTLECPKAITRRCLQKVQRLSSIRLSQKQDGGIRTTDHEPSQS